MVMQGDQPMAATKKNAWMPWHGFAIEIGPDTDLQGDGLLVYEYASGGYAPVAAVSTPNEAQEISASYRPEAAGAFKLWARGILGRYGVRLPEARAIASRFREIYCVPEERKEAAALVRRLACIFERSRGV